MITALSWAALGCAAVPAALFLRNLWLYRPVPAPLRNSAEPQISVLIPARNEEQTIAAALDSLLASQGAEFEVVVLDDGSTDATAVIVQEYARRDPRVRLASAPEPPPGWCGKQHACHALSREARYPLMVFLDADVRLAPDALARFAAFLKAGGCELASGVPRQITGGFLERLLIPLIHFVLLGFLPMDGMRRSLWPSLGAGCGQLFIARRSAYEAAGGHAAAAGEIHDGLSLPRTFRRAGFRTDLFDATDTASCRMYDTAGKVWNGLLKNAVEGIGSPRLIVPSTFLLGCGSILPWVLLFLGGGKVAAAALACSLLPRLAGALRFRQSWLGAFLHPLGVLCLLTIQWQAFVSRLRGRGYVWKGRALPLPAQSVTS